MGSTLCVVIIRVVTVLRQATTEGANRVFARASRFLSSALLLVNVPVASISDRSEQFIIPAIATCLSDPLDRPVIGVVGHLSERVKIGGLFDSNTVKQRLTVRTRYLVAALRSYALLPG